MPRKALVVFFNTNIIMYQTSRSKDNSPCLGGSQGTEGAAALPLLSTNTSHIYMYPRTISLIPHNATPALYTRNGIRHLPRLTSLSPCLHHSSPVYLHPSASRSSPTPPHRAAHTRP